jgi:small subunit ribosomal protein S7
MNAENESTNVKTETVKAVHSASVHSAEHAHKTIAHKETAHKEHKASASTASATPAANSVAATAPATASAGAPHHPAAYNPSNASSTGYSRQNSYQSRDFRGRDRNDNYADTPADTEEYKPMFVKKALTFPENKMFGKWLIKDVVVNDLSLMRYVGIDSTITPHSFGRKTRGRFAKGNINIVERLVNKLMRSGQGKRKLSGKFIRGRGSCGKKLQALKIVEKAFIVVEKQSKQNPIQMLVKAIENSAPREDITRVKKGGVAYSIAVDVSPVKRLDEAIKNIALAAFGNSFNKKVSAEQALADEIIAAASNDIKSTAVKRREEVERIAKASR